MRESWSLRDWPEEQISGTQSASIQGFSASLSSAILRLPGLGSFPFVSFLHYLPKPLRLGNDSWGSNVFNSLVFLGCAEMLAGLNWINNLGSTT